jgi:acyl transferase domain-containing protein/acyl carrier protein
VAVVGHSMGEVAAAHVAGALHLDAATRIIGERSRLLQTVSGRGGMALVELSVDEAHAALIGREDRLSIAVSNSTRSTVIAGDNAALGDVLVSLEARGVFCRRVKVDVASHSPQVNPLLGDLAAALAGTAGLASPTEMYSTVTGAPIDGKALDTGYWVRNLREPVQFAAAIRRLVADGYSSFVEISPHPLLVPAVQEELGILGRPGLVVPSLRREGDERGAMLDTLSLLYMHGVPVRWSALYPARRRCVPLPAYPWQRARFWYEPDGQRGSILRRPADATSHPLLGAHFTSSIDPATHFWEADVTADLPWLAEHRVDGVPVLPAAAIVELPLSAAAAEFGAGPWVLERASFTTAIALVGGASRTLQLVVTAAGPGVLTFRVSSREQRTGDERPDWTLHAEGAIRLPAGDAAERPAAADPDDDLAAAEVTGQDHYLAMSRRLLEYGPAFQGVQELRRGAARVVARLGLTDTVQREAARVMVHPCLLDAAFQCLVAALPTAESDPLTRLPYVPVAVGALRIARPVGAGPWRCDARVRALTDDGATAIGEVVVTDADGAVIVDARDVRLLALARTETGVESLFYEIDWVAQPRSGPTSEQEEARGAWIILSDRRGVGQTLAGALLDAGDPVIVVHGSEHDDIGNPETYERILCDAEARFGRCRGIVHAWALDVPTPETSDDVLGQAQVHGCGSVVALVQALGRRGSSTLPPLWLLTAGAQRVPGQVGDVAVQQAPLWGLGATIRSEHPELSCRNVDLGPSPTPEELEALTIDCRHPDREDHVAVRGSTRFVARLNRRPEPPVEAVSGLRAGDAPFTAAVGSPGVLDSLVLRQARRQAPGPGQVEIEVAAVGLNFMNVMSALGIYPGYPRGVGPLGIECSGRVVAFGDDVNGFEVGHEVVAFAFDCLGTHAIADARLVARKPGRLSHEVAASLPIAFVTARYALEHLTRLRRGERVMIHAAAGGVGLAAVQLAHRLGARVFATAGSEDKRAYLVGRGVECVLDSRSLAFAADIMRATDGAGVDVVLNSLAGDAIAASLSTLSAYGRFVELGKRDIYENARLGLAPFRNNLSYFAVDLDRMARERPAVVGSLLAEVMAEIEAGEIEPLPVRVFPVSELADAFRHMAQAKHTGKVVISLAPEAARTARLAPGPAMVRADGTYVITGGLGALGLRVATWLVHEGARHLVLLGRRPPSESALAVLGELRARGARVVTIAADVADETQLAAALDDSGPPLRGVVHAAGSLDDATLLQLDARRWTSVWSPKVAGAWNLHRLTESDPLDFFVLFSSVAAFLGLSGQANYAAANAFLDALAGARHAAGQVGLSIGWGPWSEIGLAAASAGRGARLAEAGLGSLSPTEGVAALAQVLGGRRGHVAVMRFDPDAWYADRRPPFAETLATSSRETAAAPAGAPVREALRGASWNAARKVLEEYLVGQVARVLSLDRARLDVRTPLKSLGLDSLMALELRHRLEIDLGIVLSATLVWNYPTVSAIGEFLAGILGVPRDEAPPSQGAPAPGQATASVGAADDGPPADVEALMAAELARVDRLLGSESEQR